MNFLMTIYDKDVFPQHPPINVVSWEDRHTGKVVLFDDDLKVALVANKVNPFFMLPGGGIEVGEEVTDGVIRECKEETGCTVTLITFLGNTEDYRAKESKHSINYGFIAQVISHGMPELTDNEKDIGTNVQWFKIQEALAIFEEQKALLIQGKIDFYNTGFNIVRDMLFLQKAYEYLESNDMRINS